MSDQVESIARSPSIVPSEATFGNSDGDFRNIIAVVKSMVPKGTGKWLERVTQKDQRTCEFWLQGKYQPRGESQRRIVRALRDLVEHRAKLLQQFELDLR